MRAMQRRLQAVLLVFLAVCSVSAQSPVDELNDDYCEAQPVANSACAWREDCTREECSKCVLNRDRINNLRHLEDRAFSEQYWELCPQLATIVKLTLPVVAPSRVLPTQAGVPIPAPPSTGNRRLLESSALEALAALGGTRILQQRDDRRARGDGDDTEVTSSVGDTPVDTPAAPQLNASPQPTASGTAALAATAGAIPAHYSLECPMNATVDGGEALLVRFGEGIQSVFQSYANGSDLTLDQEKFAFALGRPNRWLTLLNFLLDPPSINIYMTHHCSSHVVGPGRVNERVSAARWLRQDFSRIPDTQPLQICTDKDAVAWKQFHQGFAKIGGNCAPPFGNDACYPRNTWLYVMDSAQCGAEYATMFGAQFRTLQDLADLNEELHNDCSEITDKEECEAGGSDIAQILAARADILHAKLPFRAAQEGSALAAAVASRMAADAESLLASAQAGEHPQDIQDISGETDTDTRGQAAGSASGDDTIDDDTQSNMRHADTVILVAAIVASGVLLCAACAAALCWQSRRNKARMHGDSTDISKLPDASEKFSKKYACESVKGGRPEKGAMQTSSSSFASSSPTAARTLAVNSSVRDADSLAPCDLHTPVAGGLPPLTRGTSQGASPQATGLQMHTISGGPNSSGAPEYSMFARSTLGEASPSPSMVTLDAAGGASALESMPSTHGVPVGTIEERGGDASVYASMQSMHEDEINTDPRQSEPAPPRNFFTMANATISRVQEIEYSADAPETVGNRTGRSTRHAFVPLRMSLAETASSSTGTSSRHTFTPMSETVSSSAGNSARNTFVPRSIADTAPETVSNRSGTSSRHTFLPQALAPMHSSSSMHSALGESAGGSSMHSGSLLGGASASLGGLRGGSSRLTSRRGDQDSCAIPLPGGAPGSSPAKPGLLWSGDMPKHVRQALNMMQQFGELFATRYELLDLAHDASGSCTGGSGVVQYACDTTSGEYVAIKIFTKEGAFEAEQHMHEVCRRNPALQAAVGARPILADNADGAAMCQFSGFVFPPYSIVRKALTLDECLLRRGAVDVQFAKQVIDDVLKCMKALHEAGFAHRNIKPSNIWQQANGQWSLANFTSSCEFGSMSPSPEQDPTTDHVTAYTAPELIPPPTPRGARTTPPTHTVNDAEDVWALGVLAYELLTPEHMHALHAYATSPLGSDALWDARGSANLWRAADAELPGVKAFVCACMQRDPAQRAPAELLHEGWKLVTSSERDFAREVSYENGVPLTEEVGAVESSFFCTAHSGLL